MPTSPGPGPSHVLNPGPSLVPGPVPGSVLLLGGSVVVESIEQHASSVVAHGQIAPAGGTERQGGHLAQGGFL